MIHDIAGWRRYSGGTPHVLAIFACCLALAGCGTKAAGARWPKVGDAARGKIVIMRSGCGSCHSIPGVMHADGMVGPPLTNFSQRTIIAGVLPNTPPNLIRWVQHPQQVVPGNAMPEAGLSDVQARDAAAYLYTVR